MLIEHSPGTWQCAKDFAYILSFNPLQDYEINTIIMFSTNGKPEGSKRVDDMPEVTQPEQEPALSSCLPGPWSDPGPLCP